MFNLSDVAKMAVYDSYGGINTFAVYLKPETSVATISAESPDPDTAGEAQQPDDSGDDLDKG